MGRSWIGGDLAGLQHIGQVMAPAPGALRGVVSALSSGVQSVTGSAGWSGGAAEAFVAEWSTSAIQAGGMAEVMGAVGTTIGGLGDTLQEIEAQLYNAAHAAATRGAVVGADGRPGTMVVSGDASDPRAVAAIKAQEGYVADHAQAMHLAQGYRLQAAEQLDGLAAQLTPVEGLSADQAVTLGSYVRGLYTAPNEGNTRAAGTLPQNITDATDEFRDARKELHSARSDYADMGRKLPANDVARLEHSALNTQLRSLRSELKAATGGAGELPLSRALNTQLVDVPGTIPYLAGLPRSLQFLKSIPVVDVAASGIVAELQSRDDMEKGWSAEEARAKDYTAAGLGLVAGVGTGVLIAGAPVLLVAAFAGGAAIFVSSAVYNTFHENWSRDIDEHGVVGGIWVGSNNVAEATNQDVVDLFTGAYHSANDASAKVNDAVADAAGSVWNKVFG